MCKAQRIEELFQELIELSTAEEREEYLDRVCCDDSKLRQRLEALIGAHEEAGSFLREDKDCQYDSTVDLGQRIQESERIGPYKLRELIGEGGMGSVYVAEQDKPLRRKVALKVIKPGMDSKLVLGRFEAERNALALMNHPNIAKVLDAGETGQGRPFFVMELVNGIPITQYCDDQKLTIRQRLELFTDVCQAIQHAHQKGIIHRDIKPSNVLVTELDGKPIAKVIDFGVAKALNKSLTEHSVYTAFQTVIGTPLYMSPEQASFSAVDVDTRSDVYSLGVLLYELLTGTTPFTNDDLKNAAQDEVFRFIRESEPPRPSNRISSLGDTATTISQRRQADPDQLGRSVRGDLDWIVMKALAKERPRRYKTTDAFAEDVNRYLNDLPVDARPESTLYRLSRFYRRNRAAVWVAGIILVLASASLVGMYAQQRRLVVAFEANRELLIQQMLLEAFEGNIDRVEQMVLTNKDVFEDDQWPDVIHATALAHSGAYERTRALLEPIVEANPDSIPAIALLSVAHVHDGYWNEGMICRNRLKQLKPQDSPYEDLDKLFLGYGLGFIDSDQSIKYLNEVIEEHPTWLVCHAFLADTLLQKSRDLGKKELAFEAARRAEALLVFAPDNPYVMNVYVSAAKEVVQWRLIEGEAIGDVVEKALPVAEELMEIDDFSLGKLMPAQFYGIAGYEAESSNAWREFLKDTNGFHRWSAAGALYGRQKYSPNLLETIEALRAPSSDHWMHSAKCYLLADVAARRNEALSEFRRFSEIKDSDFCDRYAWIYVPLLLGETQVAKVAAQRWVNQYDAGEFSGEDTSSEFAEEELLRIVATGDASGVNSDGRLIRVSSHQMLGLLAIAEGNRDEAITQLRLAIEPPYVNLDHLWAKAFLWFLENEPEWPRGNAKLTAEYH